MEKILVNFELSKYIYAQVFIKDIAILKNSVTVITTWIQTSLLKTTLLALLVDDIDFLMYFVIVKLTIVRGSIFS